MAGVVVDTSVWIEFFAGTPVEAVDDALAHGAVIVPPLAVAELVSGAVSLAQRNSIAELLQDAPVHDTPLEHWIQVGELRRRLARKGLNVTVPDAHVAQCALDSDAILLSRDAIFQQIARHAPLRVKG